MQLCDRSDIEMQYADRKPLYQTCWVRFPSSCRSKLSGSDRNFRFPSTEWFEYPVQFFVRGGAECKSADVFLGDQKNLEDCVNAVRKNGGQHFVYGYGSRSGKCFQENTNSASCPEGWKGSEYDFYSLRPSGWSTQDVQSADSSQLLIKEGHYCGAGDEYLDAPESLEACSDAVRKNGGKFFSYQAPNPMIRLVGRCLQAKTKLATCPEGFIRDTGTRKMNFYSIDPSDPVRACEQNSVYMKQFSEYCEADDMLVSWGEKPSAKQGLSIAKKMALR